MRKYIVIGSLILVSLVVAAIPAAKVSSFVINRSEIAATETRDGASNIKVENKRGNGFFRALGAPFRAIGKLFGRGKNKNNGKLHRLTEKDVRKFESTRVTRVIDSNNPTNNRNSEDAAASRIVRSENTLTEAGAHMELGREFLNKGDLDGAISELSLAASLDPKLSEASNLLGIAYDRKGLSQRALESFQTSVHAKDDVPQHLNNLGYLLYKNGDYAGAIKYLKRAVKLAPDEQRFWNNLGLAQAQRGNFDDAYKSFARAAGEFDGRLNVAARLERQGFPKDAIKHLEKARALRPDSTEVLTRLATLYESMGKKEQAELARNSLRSLRTVATAPAPK